MHHVALDRTGADDRDLYHEVVETARAHPRQEVHLRPAFDLEDAKRVGPAQHVVDGRVLGRQRGERVVGLMVRLQQRERLADAGQHAEREHVDLQDAKRVDIVLVPADDGAVLHRRVLDGDQFVKPAFGDDEAAHMLAEVPWETDDLLDQADGLFQARAVGVEADLAHPVKLGPGLGP
jgi:hypothetical protein